MTRPRNGANAEAPLSTSDELGAPAREWSTASVPASEQFGVWEQAVNEAFVPVTVHAGGAAAFLSGVNVRRVGGIDVAEIVSEAQTVSRSAAEAERSPGDVYFLNLPLSEGSHTTQDGRTASLRPGDFAVVDGDRPFDLAFDAPFHQISLKIPRELVERRIRRSREVVGRRFAGDRGTAAVAGAAIRATAKSMASLDRRSARELGERLADLVSLAAGDLNARQDAPAPLLWRAVREAAERHLDDPDLTPARIAERVGISVRHLHRLFAENGPSFGRWVLRRRLELAFADIVDPQLVDRPIARIAMERGFGDPSYFSRAFRIRYDLTPREARAAAVRRSSTAPSEKRALSS